MERVILCAVWPTENLPGSSLNQMEGWTNVRESYSRALEQRPLFLPRDPRALHRADRQVCPGGRRQAHRVVHHIQSHHAVGQVSAFMPLSS